MTNDTAMTKQESEVMIEQLKKVFEVVRLLDVDDTGNGKSERCSKMRMDFHANAMISGKKVHVVRTVLPKKHYRKKKKY